MPEKDFCSINTEIEKLSEVKRCLLIDPDGKREFTYKNAVMYTGIINTDELKDYVNQLSSSRDKLSDVINRGNCREYSGIIPDRLKIFVLIYYEFAHRDNYCNCICRGIKDHYRLTGMVGVAKFINEIQVDYEDGDLEIIIICKKKLL